MSLYQHYKTADIVSLWLLRGLSGFQVSSIRFSSQPLIYYYFCVTRVVQSIPSEEHLLTLGKIEDMRETAPPQSINSKDLDGLNSDTEVYNTK